MNTRTFFLLLGLSILTLHSCGVKEVVSDSRPFSHEKWTQLLQKHVSPEGKVNYQGFIDDKKDFEEYLNLLRNNHPNKGWSEKARLAYWINAYNAFTVQLVADHYPVESIKDIKRGIPFVNSVWEVKFIEIEGAKYSLGYIEHKILRKEFDEPRIHFAINCASVSCPRLLDEAFVVEKLDSQLDSQTKEFLADKTKNKIQRSKVELSKIFSWFGKDFKKEGTLVDYINPYTEKNIMQDAKIEFLPYDWNLNE